MILSRVSYAFGTANSSFIAFSINLGFTGLSKMMAHLQVGKEKSTIHVFDEFNQHRCSSECCGPRFVISYREKNCHERSIAMGQNVLLFRHLCIKNFNCSVDFREFSRYTTITKNIIVFPFYVTERSAKIMQLKCLTQNKFCSLLQCFRF